MKFQLVCFLFWTVISAGFSQNQNSIIDKIQKNEFGEGKVTIHQDAQISDIIGKRNSASSPSTEKEHIKISGYRVQVFSGNNQRLSKEEAFKKEQLVKEFNSEISTYITYKSPFWRLRVGDFRNYEEAYLLLRQLMKEFPNFGKEMYVVREEITIPL
ncbi:MAG: SPOR domain-containing protein [Bacteroidales bacterium]|nr:SPOR domain-containing protein [Bacteroidales bacterium]